MKPLQVTSNRIHIFLRHVACSNKILRFHTHRKFQRINFSEIVIRYLKVLHMQQKNATQLNGGRIHRGRCVQTRVARTSIGLSRIT